MYPLSFCRRETVEESCRTQLSYHCKQISFLSQRNALENLKPSWRWINLSTAPCCFSTPALSAVVFDLHFLNAIWDFPKRIFIWSFFVLMHRWEKMKNSSPKKLSADCWPTVDRQSANSWPTVGRQSTDSRPTVGRLLADCWPTVGRLSFTAFYENRLPAVGRLLTVCRPTVGRMSVICWPSVGWEPLSKTRKASARREEHCISTRNETFSLEFAIVLVFLGTNLLAIPSHHPRSQEAKNLFTAASCSSFRNHQIKQKSMTSFYCLILTKNKLKQTEIIEGAYMTR